MFGTITQMIALSKSFVYFVPHLRFIIPYHKLVKEYVAEEPISPEKCLGICQYCFARGDYLYTVAKMTGLTESIVYKIVIEVRNAILENFWTYAVDRHFPKSVDDFHNKLQEMECAWQFKYALAAIEGSHCLIKFPAGEAESMKQYYYFENFYLVVLMALVDAHYRFILAIIGAPGNTHNSTYFQSTSLWEKLRRVN